MEGQQTGENAQPTTGDATGQQPANGQQGNGGAGDEKRFTQAELDAHIKARLDQAQRNAEAKAQKERDAANAEALKEQSKFKELAEQREKQIGELEPFRAKAERYETALGALLEQERKGLPAHITALLDKLDAAEQLEWIAANRDALTTSDDKKPAAQQGTPPTPRPANGTSSRADDIKQRTERLAASGSYPRF